MLIDATRPYHWREKYAMVSEMSDELADQLRVGCAEELFSELPWEPADWRPGTWGRFLGCFRPSPGHAGPLLDVDIDA